jgi:hypothetical protein
MVWISIYILRERKEGEEREKKDEARKETKEGEWGGGGQNHTKSTTY